MLLNPAENYILLKKIGTLEALRLDTLSTTDIGRAEESGQNQLYFSTTQQMLSKFATQNIRLVRALIDSDHLSTR